MSEEQIKIWKKVEAKGLEKLGNIEKALLAKEGFKEAHKDYCDFVDRLAETTGLTTGELDRHFTTLLAEKEEKKNEGNKEENANSWRFLCKADGRERNGGRLAQPLYFQVYAKRKALPDAGNL